jgi:Spy/CpxP family protein refolding chaperone
MRRVPHVVAVLVGAAILWATTVAGAAEPKVSERSQGTGANADSAPGTIAGLNSESLTLLNLTDEQRARITEVQRNLQRKRWELTAVLREDRWRLQDILNGPELDADAARKVYESMLATRKEMFNAALDARKQIELALTKQQRDQLRLAKTTTSQGAKGQPSKVPR